MNLIVAVDSKWGIGKNGNLLFRIPEDMKFFKQKTLGTIIVMGRKTLESFPNRKPLENRTNIVLTSNPDYKKEGSIICNTKEAVLEQLKKQESDNIFIIGGESIYKQFLPYCDTAYVTKIYHTFCADTYMENLDENKDWTLSEKSELLTYKNISFAFTKYMRK